jgi:hypothetical protein
VLFRSSLFTNLQNQIESNFVRWERNQTAILDMKRQHDTLIAQFPNVVWSSVMNRSQVDVVIVTSTATKRAFEDGTDDRVLFDKVEK